MSNSILINLQEMRGRNVEREFEREKPPPLLSKKPELHIRVWKMKIITEIESDMISLKRKLDAFMSASERYEDFGSLEADGNKTIPYYINYFRNIVFAVSQHLAVAKEAHNSFITTRGDTDGERCLLNQYMSTMHNRITRAKYACESAISAQSMIMELRLTHVLQT